MCAQRDMFLGNIPLGTYNDKQHLLLEFLENRFIFGKFIKIECITCCMLWFIFNEPILCFNCLLYAIT